MRVFFFVAVMGVLLILLLGCEKKVDSVVRGKYLVTVGGCHDCHTPTLPGPGGMPVPDTTRLLSGHPEGVPHPSWTPADIQQRNTIAMAGPMLTAWAGPWGVSFAANLTSDNGTGLGAWTEAEFIQAVRTGKHHGHPNGREILPPMPWQNLKDATDSDLKAMWAYMRSIPAIKNRVPFPVPPAAPPMEGRGESH